MGSFIKKNWWKGLAIILLSYTILFSFLVPLAPGIKELSPSSLAVGDNEIKLTGYNTDFKNNIDKVSISLEYNNKTLACATDISLVNSNQLSFNVYIPQDLPSKNIHLRVSTTNYSILEPEIVRVYDANKVVKDEYSICSPLAYKSSRNINIPNRLLLNETIRNLMLHVPMWFAMMLIMGVGFVYSLKYLRSFDLKNDLVAQEAVNISLLFAFLGLVTGSIWAKFTWSDHTELFSLTGWWANDVKLNGAAITTLIYLAYRILRNAIKDEHQKAKISAVYNIFAFTMMVVFIMVLPRITDSLHPGNGGNPAFSKYDLDSTLRMVFYPSVIGWILLGVWMLNLKVRLGKLQNKIWNNEE
jgi:heme exporter protein C